MSTEATPALASTAADDHWVASASDDSRTSLRPIVTGMRSTCPCTVAVTIVPLPEAASRPLIRTVPFGWALTSSTDRS